MSAKSKRKTKQHTIEVRAYFRFAVLQRIEKKTNCILIWHDWPIDAGQLNIWDLFKWNVSIRLSCINCSTLYARLRFFFYRVCVAHVFHHSKDVFNSSGIRCDCMYVSLCVDAHTSSISSNLLFNVFVRQRACMSVRDRHSYSKPSSIVCCCIVCHCGVPTIKHTYTQTLTYSAHTLSYEYQY